MKSKKSDAEHPSTSGVESDRQCLICIKHHQPGLTGPTKFLRLPEVMERTTLKRSTLLAMVKRGNNSDRPPFPSPIKITAGCNAWPSHEIESWIAKVTAFSRQSQQ